MRRAQVAVLIAGLALALPSAATSGERAEGGWTSAHPIPASLPDRPAVAVNRHGAAVLAFAEGDGAWLARIDATGRLARARRIPGPPGPADVAAVALTDRGQVTVAWRVGDSPRLIVATWKLGRPPARGVAISGTGLRDVALAAGPRAATLAWSEERPADGDSPAVTIAVAVVDPRDPPAPTTVATVPNELAGPLSLGLDARGRATVAWTAGPRGPALTTVESAASDRFAPAAPARAHVLGRAPLDELHVLTDARGGQLAVWQSGNPLGSGSIMAARRSRGGDFSVPRIVANGRRITGLDAALNGRGRGAATWIAQGGQHPVRAALATPAGRWRKAQTITAPGHSGEQPDVEIDGRGRAIVLWGGRRGIRAASTTARGAFAGHELISVPRLCSNPQLVMASSGRAVASFLCNRRRPYKPPWSDVPLPLHELARYRAPAT